jgi:hypothetical protein
MANINRNAICIGIRNPEWDSWDTVGPAMSSDGLSSLKLWGIFFHNKTELTLGDIEDAFRHHGVEFHSDLEVLAENEDGTCRWVPMPRS